jgi:hypothetical protein
VATSSSHSGTAAASKGGLSAGAGAGIAIAALLVLAGLAIGAFVFWRKRYHNDRRTTTTTSVPTRDEVPTGLHEMSGTVMNSLNS